MGKGSNRRPEAEKGSFEQNTPFKAPVARKCNTPNCPSHTLVLKNGAYVCKGCGAPALVR